MYKGEGEGGGRGDGKGGGKEGPAKMTKEATDNIIKDAASTINSPFLS